MQIPLLNPYLDLFRAMEGQSSDFQLAIRKKLIWAYSWAVPSIEAIEALARHSPVIELGAGTGYWAWLMEQAGAKVSAFDIEPLQPPHWHPIQRGDTSVVRLYPDHTLFLCWPPIHSPMATGAIDGHLGTVVYLGEWNGRTADSHFHEKLREGWTLTEKIEIPNWPGYSDQLYILKRK